MTLSDVTSRSLLAIAALVASASEAYAQLPQQHANRAFKSTRLGANGRLNQRVATRLETRISTRIEAQRPSLKVIRPPATNVLVKILGRSPPPNGQTTIRE